MLTRLRSHISSNLIGYLALFVALGGTSYAFATGSIDSRELKNNTIRTGDLRNNEVRSRDIRNRTLVGRDHLNNSLGGDQIAESKLGEVPSATTADNALALGGTPAAGFLRGSGGLVSASVDVPTSTDSETTVLELPGLGRLSVPADPSGCDEAGEDLILRWQNQSATQQDVFFSYHVDAAPPRVSHDGVDPDAFTDSGPETGLEQDHEIRVAPVGSQSALATIDVFTRIFETNPDFCRISAQALVSG